MRKTTKPTAKKKRAGHQNFNNILKEEFGAIFNAFFVHYFNVDKNANLRDLSEAKVHRTVAGTTIFFLKPSLIWIVIF